VLRSGLAVLGLGLLVFLSRLRTGS